MLHISVSLMNRLNKTESGIFASFMIVLLLISKESFSKFVHSLGYDGTHNEHFVAIITTALLHGKERDKLYTLANTCIRQLLIG